MTKKTVLENLAEAYKEQLDQKTKECEELREDKRVLQTQIFNLQDGLMSIRAPEAYRDQKADEAGFEVDEEKQAEMRRDDGIRHKYVENLEKPTFRSADDIELLLGPAFQGSLGIAEKSIHGNDES